MYTLDLDVIPFQRAMLQPDIAVVRSWLESNLRARSSRCFNWLASPRALRRWLRTYISNHTFLTGVRS